MATIQIRACTTNDIDAVLALDREWEQEGIAHVFVPINREEFVENLAQFPAYFLVAEHNSHIVGYINGSEHRGTDASIIPTHEPYVLIENLYVAVEFRHKKIGGQLVERLFGAAEQRGIRRFLVGSNSRQIVKILTFYQDHGFTLWQVQLYK